MDGGPLAITHHLAHYGQLLGDLSQEHSLDTTLYLHKVGDPAPTTDSAPDPAHSRSLVTFAHAATTHCT